MELGLSFVLGGPVVCNLGPPATRVDYYLGRITLQHQSPCATRTCNYLVGSFHYADRIRGPDWLYQPISGLTAAVSLYVLAIRSE